MSLDVDGDSGDSDSVIDFAQAEARKKSKATSASATCARKRPHPGAEWKKEFPSLQVILDNTEFILVHASELSHFDNYTWFMEFTWGVIHA
ncbi:hypothetical protein EMCRGX_G017696 [Ephydatia muelleri]